MSLHTFADQLRTPEDRRAFLEKAATMAFGLTVLPAFAGAAESAAPKAPNAALPGFGKAKNVIFLELQGGMSHIDTFDPKTGASKGPGDAVSTKAGFQITSFLPNTAKISDKICVIRSMTAKVGVHASAQYLMRTGFEQRGVIQHPNFGAWAQHFLGRSSQTLPANVCVNRPSNQGNGWFPASHAPLPILDPATGLPNTSGVGDASAQQKRATLLSELDRGFGAAVADSNVKAYNDFYASTFELMRSRDLKAFDIASEPKAVRAKYGADKFAQGCLLARRLVEHGVRFVEVRSGGWDMHATLEDRMEDVGAEFDAAFAALVEDLESKGLLDTTLVAVSTEFGRKPNFEGGGRGHHPLAFSTVLVGGGVKRGYVHGASDAKGYDVAKDPVTAGAFHATVAHAAGLPLGVEIMTPSGRPMMIGNKAAPVTAVFA
ncbi:MAG: DUF1501 domain-containing protein [Verrucomicrobia bacterium]|nr:DUF1501 domain-containing protein [Verrucomicrobiota bacterium]